MGPLFLGGNPPGAADNRPNLWSFLLASTADGRYPVPRDAYYMSGPPGGQTTLMIFPRTNLVVVRSRALSRRNLRGAARLQARPLALLIEAVAKSTKRGPIHPPIEK